MPKPNLDDYVDVATRIQRFYERFPEGSLQTEIIFDDGKRVVTKSYAFRKPHDKTPAIGHAEEIRGEGMVNKTSALENCETSSTGRALAMLGLEVKKFVASREEIEQALAEEERQKKDNGRPAGKPVNLVTKEWAEGARQRTLDIGVDMDEVVNKLTSFNVEKLEELTEPQAAIYDAWLSKQAKAVVTAAESMDKVTDG